MLFSTTTQWDDSYKKCSCIITEKDWTQGFKLLLKILTVNGHCINRRNSCTGNTNGKFNNILGSSLFSLQEDVKQSDTRHEPKVSGQVQYNYSKLTSATGQYCPQQLRVFQSLYTRHNASSSVVKHLFNSPFVMLSSTTCSSTLISVITSNLNPLKQILVSRPIITLERKFLYFVGLILHILM